MKTTARRCISSKGALVRYCYTCILQQDGRQTSLRVILAYKMSPIEPILRSCRNTLGQETRCYAFC